MAAAVNYWGDFNSVANVQCADSLGAVRLVSRYRKQIDILPNHVNRNFSDGLCGIAVEENSALTAEFSYFRDWLKHSGFVVCGHDGDQDGCIVYGLFQGAQINQPILLHG